MVAYTPDTVQHAAESSPHDLRYLRRAAIAVAVGAISLGIAAAAGRFAFVPLADAASATFLLWTKPRIPPAPYWNWVDFVPWAIAAVAVALSAMTFLVVAGMLGQTFPGTASAGRLRRFVRGAVRAIWVAGVFALVIPAGMEGERRVAAPGRGDFVAHCGRCHSTRRPLDFIQPRTGWENTVHRMAAKPGAAIDEPAAARIVGYLAAIRSISTPALVRGRCGRCHEPPAAGSVDEAPLRIRRMVDRLRALDSRLCEPDEADAVAAYLASGKISPPPYPAALQDRFERVCETCHFLDVVREPLLHGNWTATLTRMQGKSPALLSAAEALELETVVRAETADPRGFRRRYPHSGISDPWPPRR